MEHIPHTPTPDDGEQPARLDRLAIPDYASWSESIRQAAQAIQAGIREAFDAAREIDDRTAVLIAQVLSISLRLDKVLWDFDPSEPIDYEALRERYLLIYNDPETPAYVQHWIDWFGTYLVHRSGVAEGSTGLDRSRAPKLNRTLVTHEFALNGFTPVRGQIPASMSDEEIQEAEARLWDQDLARTPAFRAFLGMPGVDATDPLLIDHFHSIFVGSYGSMTDALFGLSRGLQWEKELQEWARERGLPGRMARLDLSVLRRVVTSAADLVEFEGRVYAFEK